MQDHDKRSEQAEQDYGEPYALLAVCRGAEQGYGEPYALLAVCRGRVLFYARTPFLPSAQRDPICWNLEEEQRLQQLRSKCSYKLCYLI